MAMGWAMEILQKAWWLFSTASGALCLVSGSLYLAPLLYLGTLGGVQNVKNKYGATWALVTGGSSGIGKAVVRKLASQVRVRVYMMLGAHLTIYRVSMYVWLDWTTH